MPSVSRRKFFSVASSSAAVGATTLQQLRFPALRAEDTKLDNSMVRFRPEIEPLVKMLEDTPREKIIDAATALIRSGTSYRELLSALFLAGIRNVQPRPSVGFKFHSVLVVNSAHQASIAAKNESRWLPLLWAIDYFKSAQATDVKEGNWTMAAVNENRLPTASQSLIALDQAMDQWDETAADAAAAQAARVATSSQLLDIMARNAARDFRSIGHKSIYVAGAFRLLGVIGWEHSEPVMRSLAYAILNHSGEGNPSKSDSEADRAGRRNWELIRDIPDNWLAGRHDSTATLRVLQGLRELSPIDSSAMIVEMLSKEIHPRSIYDGILLASSELVTRQPAIVPLHAVTTSNALHYLFHSVSDDSLRRWLLLQNASFVAHFREAAKSREKLPEKHLDELIGSSNARTTIDGIFANVHRDRASAAEEILQFLDAGGNAESLIGTARELVFLKGSDSHDYKLSSAAIEDFYAMDPRWRNRYLAGCSYLLHGSSEKTTALADKVLANSI
ncbi:MAG: hypothetical protein SGI77_25770 [Pirellulaceae bacterium]|nr:hypothetical protein [Pirellulaceae bacterium]